MEKFSLEFLAERTKFIKNTTLKVKESKADVEIPTLSLNTLEGRLAAIKYSIRQTDGKYISKIFHTEAWYHIYTSFFVYNLGKMLWEVPSSQMYMLFVMAFVYAQHGLGCGHMWTFFQKKFQINKQNLFQIVFWKFLCTKKIGPSTPGSWKSQTFAILPKAPSSPTSITTTTTKP